MAIITILLGVLYTSSALMAWSYFLHISGGSVKIDNFDATVSILVKH